MTTLALSALDSPGKKGIRDLQIGIHSTVTVGDRCFDVETETRAAGSPAHTIVDTTVYAQGRVMYRRVKAFDESAATQDQAAALKELVVAQHRGVVEDLRSEVLKFESPADIAAPSVSSQAPIEFPRGIEVRLLNAGSWLVLGTASLNIDVKGRATNKPAGGVTVEVVLDGAEPPFRIQAGADPLGRVSLVFPMPRIGPEGGELIIRASGAAGRDEVRYRLRAKAAARAKKVQTQ